MRTLYESILDGDNKVIKNTLDNSRRHLFKVDEQVRREEIVKLLVRLFDIKDVDDDYDNFIGYIDDSKLEKKCKELEKELKKLNYFYSISVKGSRVGRMLDLYFPIDEENIFRRLSISVGKFYRNVRGKETPVTVIKLTDYNGPTEGEPWWIEIFNKL